MNLGTLTTLAAQFAQDPQQSRYAGLYTQALNLAQQQFSLDAKCSWKDWASTVAVSGTSSYSLPSDFMWEKKLTFNGLKLTPISRSELEDIYTGTSWQTVTGTPTKYIIDPDESKKQVVLFPIPQDADAGKSIVLTYFALPTDMANPTDIPINSTLLLAQFHIALAAWAAWYLLQSEPVTEAIALKKKELLSIYNDQVSKAVETFKNTASEPLRMKGVRTYSW